MAAITTYPTDLTDDENKLVRGDPVAIVVKITDTSEDALPLEDRFWRAHIRTREDGSLLMQFTVEVLDEDHVVLRLNATQATALKDGMKFDLEETTGDDPPVTLRTWWKVTHLGVVKDVSHA